MMKDTQLNGAAPIAAAVLPADDLVARLLAFLGIGAVARPRQAAPAFPFERAFDDEAGAVAFAERMREQGHHAEVHHCDYDYSWSVEVFASAPGGATAG